MSIHPDQIFSVKNEADFNELTLAIFHHQRTHCEVYKRYLQNLSTDLSQLKHYRQIPFLPIAFFKSHIVKSTSKADDIVFSSSGTTGQSTSKHHVSNIELYRDSYNKAFELFYGPAADYCILALLPSYLEREGSSLIYMVDDLLKQSTHPQSGYFLYNLQSLCEVLQSLQAKKQKTILFGVTYALLDLVEQFDINFSELVVMETGGMKGKRKEMVRDELHEQLRKGLGVNHIHSEYGMTELLSQAYSKGNGIFACPPWMKVILRDTLDPLSLAQKNQTGGINVIDLANINSCSFIATQDLGRLNASGDFEVIGRFDNSDIRGCNLLVQ